MDFLTLFLIGAFCVFGLFYEYLACAAGLVLILYLVVYARKHKTLTFRFNMASVAVIAITAGYLLSIFYAIDKGAAVVGLVKFLPVLLFLTVLMQQNKPTDDYLKIIPPVACVMTVVSAVLMQVPVLTNWFSVSGRLSGFFQYSNTFALFLLIALIITTTKEKLEKIDYLYVVVFVFGILYSGSRTVFVLSAVALLAVIIFGKNKKNKIIFLVAAVAATITAVLYTAVSGNFDTIGRFLTLSLQESTFVGRFLYFIDALPVILRHPFGLGYLGYYYMQPSFQTGVYSVKFVHNEFLQLLLDIGFVPTAIFAAAIIRSFLKKGGNLRKRLLLLIITIHICFDFDLQFVSIFMLFVMLLDYKDGQEKKVRFAAIPMVSVAAVLSVLSIYTGTAQAFSYFKKYDIAAKIYPWDSFAQVKILETADLSPETEKRADWVINHNEYIAAAYNKKALSAYYEGDFTKVIEYKQKAVDTFPFSYEIQEEYCHMLINGIYLYEQNNDPYSVKICQQELLKTVRDVQNADSRLSKLGKMIDDQPVTELPDDITEYVRQLNAAQHP